MHLLVLSAFRPESWRGYGVLGVSQCTFWCSVLSDHIPPKVAVDDVLVSMHLLVLSAFRQQVSALARIVREVSMHLLVLSAFRQGGRRTFRRKLRRVSMHLLVLSAFRLGALQTDDPVVDSLNAPFGAQCFPTVCPPSWGEVVIRSQCTFWCSVLSDSMSGVWISLGTLSQCTFWCSVLSDFSS